MNHAITIGSLLLFFGAIAGFGLMAVGALSTFAGGMSDAPEAGESAGTWGCILIIAGVVLFVGSVVGMV